MSKEEPEDPFKVIQSLKAKKAPKKETEAKQEGTPE